MDILGTPREFDRGQLEPPPVREGEPLPDVSVIIPTTCESHRADALRRSIASVRRQTDVSVSLIIVVNGRSFDRALLAELRADANLEVRYLEKANLPAALRFGRSLVNTTFFAFLDDDDEYLTGALRTRIQPMLDKREIDVVATNGYRRLSGRDVILYRDAHYIQTDYLRAIVDGLNWLASGGAAFRSSTIGIDYFDGETKFLEWTLLAFRLAVDNRRILFLDIPTFRLYDTPDSLSKSTGYLTGSVAVIEKMFRLNLPKRILPALRRKRTRALHALCAYHRISGDFKTAWACHMASMRSLYGLRYLPYTALLLLRLRFKRTTPSTKAEQSTALLLGSPYFTKQLATLLSSESWKPMTLESLKRKHMLPLFDRSFRVVYQVGGPHVPSKLLRFCSLFGKRMIIHWIGSDVSEAFRSGSLDVLKEKRIITHWADAPWLADELKKGGLAVEVMPLFAVDNHRQLPLPGGPLTVLTYLPDEKFGFYGGTLTMALAEQFPALHFLVVGGTGRGIAAPPNVQFLGWRDDMHAIYARAHVLLRIPVHDGLSFMVMESLSYARHAIWNHEHPGVLFAPNDAAVKEHLARLHAEHVAGLLKPNNVGRSYVTQEFAFERSAERIRLGLRRCLNERTRAGVEAARDLYAVQESTQ